MKDFTVGSIPRHLIVMAIPMAFGMLAQTLYYLVDLFFVGRIGATALAGVSAAGNAMFIVMALTQILAVGTLSLIAHAVGRKDRGEASLIFNQSLLMSLFMGVLTLIGGYAVASPYMTALAADAATYQAGMTYLYWFIPGLAIQFALISISAALRGSGIVAPVMIIQMLSVLINAILSPILIAGWLTGRPMGVAGAGLATTISVVIGTLILWAYYVKRDHYVEFSMSQWVPRLSAWKRIFGIGIPAGGEFLLMFLYMAIIHWAISRFGADAQAGFGLGSRVMQALFLPAMAVAFSAPAVAGQNFGARNAERVRSTARWALIFNVVLMVPLALLCQLTPTWFVQVFSSEPDVVETAVTFLRTISWNFLFAGLIFVASGMFQALGNTWPAVISTGTRLVTFALPLFWLTGQDWFTIQHIWYLSVATVIVQSGLSWWLMQREFRLRLNFSGDAPLVLPA